MFDTMDEIFIRCSTASRNVRIAHRGLTRRFITNSRPAHKADTNNFMIMDDKLYASCRRITNNIYSMSSILESDGISSTIRNLSSSEMGEYTDQGTVVDLGNQLQM